MHGVHEVHPTYHKQGGGHVVVVVASGVMAVVGWQCSALEAEP